MTSVTPEKELELTQLDRMYDNMLTLAEINISNRPCIRSFDSRNRPVSFLVIPTLEDLKHTMFGTLGHFSMIHTIVSRITEILTELIHKFTKECTSHGGTARYLTPMILSSVDGLLRKYYPE